MSVTSIENERGDELSLDDDTGSIAVRDIDGDSLDTYEVDEPEWAEYARLFDRTEDDFPLCPECDVRHGPDHLA